MEDEQTQTNMKLTEEERMLLRVASGEPYNHGAIVGGVRALIADWVRRGQPVLEPEPEVTA
jgi:hypothetical protein